MNEIKTIHSSFNGFIDIKLYTADRLGLRIYDTEKKIITVLTPLHNNAVSRPSE
jgi:hypothetical protein